MSIAHVGRERDSTGSHWDGIAPALAWLERALVRAVAARRMEVGPVENGAVEAFRGLIISDAEVDRLLARPSGDDESDGDHLGVVEGEPLGPRFGWLGRSFGLGLFELGVVLLALAPHIDGKYRQIYSYLHDDLTRCRPTVALALDLFGVTPGDRLALRARFAADAPLRRYGLLRLAAEPDQVDLPLPFRTLVLDAQIVDALTGQAGLDDRLVPFCRLEAPEACPAWPVVEPELHVLAALAVESKEQGRPLRLYFQGPPGRGQRQAAEALAWSIDEPLLSADLGHAERFTDDLARILVREACFQGAVLLVEGLDATSSGEAARETLASHLSGHAGLAILTGPEPWPMAVRPKGTDGPLGLLTMPFDPPGAAVRLVWWRDALADHGVAISDDSLTLLADRFRLGPEAIAEAAASGTLSARLRAAGTGAPAQPLADDFAAATRSLTGQALAALAWRIEPRAGWDDLVVPVDTRDQLEELCRRATGRRRVMEDWGFARKLSRGLGVSALFAGPAGVGKTLAAEVVASALGLDLYVIDLSGIVSKYIGETEKNLDRVFEAAQAADAVLLFDEADALFGKRSEVRDAHDRYANIEISYLLQKIELYEGVALLATNLRQNLDDAFLRRLAFIVSFPFPDEPDRRRIWSTIWPRETPLGADVDLDDLARRFKLSGGQIKNIALAGAHLAASDGGVVTMAHLRHAVRREYQKLGRVLNGSELGEETP